MKLLSLLILVTVSLSMVSMLNAQNVIWEEDFEAEPEGWTLVGQNWGYTNGSLNFNWSPQTDNYDQTAISPVIELPENVNNLFVTQYVDYFTSFEDELFEIAVITDESTDVIWLKDDGIDWGSVDGQALELSLAAYQGESIQLRFRAAGTSTWNINDWYIYHLAIYGSLDNDLEALSIVGNQSVPVNEEAEYTVTVRNNGLNNQDDYLVKLMSGEVELGVLEGREIANGETEEFVFLWTPTEVGSYTLRGLVELAGDENVDNNQTASLNVFVSSGEEMIGFIGSGTDVNELMGAAPINIWFKSLRSQTVYTADELNSAGLYGNGQITALAYYVTDAPVHTIPNFRVRMRHTEAEDASSHIAGPYTEVFLNPSFSPTAGDWVMMELSTPFEWNGVDNILVDTAFSLLQDFSQSGQLRVFSSNNGMRYGRSDTIDQTDTETTLTASYKPQLQLMFVPGESLDNDLMAADISGPLNASVGSPSIFTVQIRNMGANTQSEFTVSLVDEDGTNLAELAVTQSLEQYQSESFELSWTPQTQGMINVYGLVELEGDENPNNDKAGPLSVYVHPEGTIEVDIGTGTTTATSLPLHFWFKNSVSQTLYMQEELAVGGLLTNIKYYNSFFSDLEDMPVKIWMGETELNSLDDGWIPAGQLELVFDGTVDFPSGQNTISIILDTPFSYSGASNLVVMAQRPMDENYYNSNDHFFYTVTQDYPNRSRNVQSDTIVYDPDNITAGTLTNRVPNTTLLFVTSGLGAISGEVVDDTTMEPLSGVEISIIGENRNTQTDTNGLFSINYLPSGTYTVRASIFGYNDAVIDNVLIEADEVTVLNIEMEQLSNVTISGQIVGSDFPDIGLSDAYLDLTGYENYQAETDEEGFFTIQGVYNHQTYTLTVYREGYAQYESEVSVESADLDLGIVMLDEISFPPRNVVATQNENDTAVELIWNTPRPSSDYFFDFEDGDQGWTSGAITGDNHWERGTPNQTNINSAFSGNNAFMTKLSADYENNANTWLMSPEVNLSRYDLPHFSVWLNIQTENNYDAMILEYSIDNGALWHKVEGDEGFYNNTSTFGPLDPPKWSGAIGEWEQYSTTIPEIAGEASVYLRFRFQSDISIVNEGVALDDVFIGEEYQATYTLRRNADRTVDSSILFSRLRENSQRVLEGYVVYRFLYEDIDDESSWTELTTVTDTTYTDNSWDGVDSGFYRYAVKSLHTNDVLSAPAISNWVGKDMTTNVTVNVLSDCGGSAAGSVAYLYYQDQDPDGNSPVYSQEAEGDNPAVAQFNNVLRGNYNLEVRKPTHETFVLENVDIQENTVLEALILEIPFPPHNLVYSAASNLVTLQWQPPLIGEESLSELISEIERKYRESGVTDKEQIAQVLEEAVAEYMNNPDNRVTGSEERALVGYYVYRDGVRLNVDPLENSVYQDTEVENNVTYTYYVTALYTMNESEPTNSVTATPGPMQTVLIGDGTSYATSLPINFLWKNSISQTIYMREEINAGGVVSEIKYFNNFSEPLQNMPVKIWMLESDVEDLSDGWILSGEMELVFDGYLDYPEGQNTITIELDEFFMYSGSQNLVVMLYRPMDEEWYSGKNFYYTDTPDYPNRTRHIYSDSEDYNPENVEGGYTLARVPNTGLSIVTSGMGSLDGYVYDEDDQPIEGAIVSVYDTNFTAQTNNSGYFLFSYMFEGSHTVIASMFGYHDGISEEVEIEENESTSVNFNLTPLASINVSGRIVGSDFPNVGLSNASVTLTGYMDYYTTTGTDGTFSIAGVYSNQTYYMTIDRSGYSSRTLEMAVDDSDLNLGDLILEEMAFPPSNVYAEIGYDNSYVTITWQPPSVGLRQEANSLLAKSNGVKTVRKGTDSYRVVNNSLSSENISERVLVGYILYRLQPGQEETPYAWTEITTVTGTSHIDQDWDTIMNGAYRYAVQSVYTNNVLSGYAFSNQVMYQEEISDIHNLTAEVIGNRVDLNWEWANQLFSNEPGQNQKTRKPQSEVDRSERAFLGFQVSRGWSIITDGIMETNYSDLNVPAGEHAYSVMGVYTNGTTEILYVTVEVHVNVDETVKQPLTTKLIGNYPNPFNPETMILYSLKDSGNVRIEIFNSRGQRIRTLYDGYKPAGQHSEIWNGRDDKGFEVGSGVYFYRMIRAEYIRTGRMLLMK